MQRLRKIPALTRLLVFIGLMILPALALVQTGWNLRWAGAYAVVINGIT